MKRPQVVGNICRACEPPELTLQPCLPQPKAPCPLSDTCKYFESRTSSPLNPYLGLVLDLFLKVVHQCLNEIAQQVCEWIPCCACHGSRHACNCFYKESCSESNIQMKPSSMLKCMVPTASPNREAILHTRVSGVRSWQVCEDEMPLKGIKFRSSGFNS